LSYSLASDLFFIIEKIRTYSVNIYLFNLSILLIFFSLYEVPRCAAYPRRNAPARSSTPKPISIETAQPPGETISAS